MIQLNPNDLLTLTTADGTLVEMRVQMIKPPEPQLDYVQVVFKQLSPREAAEYHQGAHPSVKRYTYSAPLDWKLKIGDQARRSDLLVTVVGYGPTAYATRHPQRVMPLTARLGADVGHDAF